MKTLARRMLENKAFDLAINDMQNICEFNKVMPAVRQTSDEDLQKYIDDMLDNGATFDYNNLALLRAEHIGVCEYKVKGNKMVYISYFGSEGFVKVVHNLDTGEEKRTSQNTTKLPYNYFCG